MSAPSLLLITARQLIDGNGGEPVRDAAVLIEGDRIVAVGPAAQASAPANVERLDAPGMTLMPGMIDCHVHIHAKGGPTPNNEYAAEMLSQTQGLMALRSYRNAHDTLLAGFTSIRSVASPDYVDLAVRDAVNQGLVEGPRIKAAGQGVCVTGGHMDKASWAPSVTVAGRNGVGDGPWGCRTAARAQLRRGADLIKINACGGAMNNLAKPWHQEMTYEEMAAVCEEAHWAEKRVAAHCSGGQGITDALRAGLDSVEHGTWLTDEQIEMMAQNGTFWIPTLTVHSRGLALGSASTGSSPNARRWMEKVCNDRWETMVRVRKAGVKIGVGTDAGFWVYHGENANELVELCQGGMTPLEAISSATRIGADCLGTLRDTGTLEPGKLADLLLIDGDPLQDITCLTKRDAIRFVFKGGTRVGASV